MTIAVFALRLFSPTAPPEVPETWRQFRRACLETLLPVLLTAVLIGATATLMGYHAFLALGTQVLIGAYAGLVSLRGLAPLLTGAMIAAKPSTALTAAIATMRASEQVDALEAMGVDPYRYLLGTAIAALAVAPGTFLADLTRFVGIRDLVCGLLKVVVFALLGGVISSYQGMRAQGGPRGVSLAITRGMVYSTLSIVVANFLLSEVFYR